MHGFIGKLYVHSVSVGVGVHGNGADAHALGGADNATGDLAAIGDEEGGEHSGGPRKVLCRHGIGEPDAIVCLIKGVPVSVHAGGIDREHHGPTVT